MKCSQCDSIIPAHYKTCPSCGGSLVKEEFVTQDNEEDELKLDGSALVVECDLDDFGSM